MSVASLVKFTVFMCIFISRSKLLPRGQWQRFSRPQDLCHGDISHIQPYQAAPANRMMPGLLIPQQVLVCRVLPCRGLR